MAEADSLVRFEDVTLHGEDGREVFRNLDWTLPRGARLRIVGDPGSGGSALLRLMTGLAVPQSGRVILDGVPHDPRLPRHPFLARGAVAWIPADGGLVSNLDLLANVSLPARYVRGMHRDDAERLALHWMERLDIGALASRRPHALEIREKLLAALARSLCMEASFWLLDRPLEEMDAAALGPAREAMDWILQRPDTTLVMVGEGRRYRPFALEVWRLEAGRLMPGETA